MFVRVVFVVFWGTLLRPTAGAVVLILTTLQNVPWLCASKQEVLGVQRVFSLRSSTATSAVNMA